MEYIIDRKWKWVECNLVIKRLPQKQYQQGLYQSLQAQVELISEQPDIKNFQSDIIMEKTFQFQQGRGFIWHKSWYIPEIVVKLSSKITKMLKQENHIKKMYCEMLSGYPFKKDQHFYLQQVKLQGEAVKQFNKKGEVNFSNIKFSQTSFNKNKNKFSIILVIFTSYKQNQRSIIKSYISSPIHVDSRKQARKKISANTFIQDQINLNKFINGLQGAQKLVNQSYTYDELLTIYGFIKYYTAANIRFKIKHPYYIGYHFNTVFDVYYNSQEANDPVEVLDLIYENQVKQSDRVKIKPKPKKQMFTDNKEILKKSCPKFLLFLIKNTPKQCYLIKQEISQSQQKIAQIQQKMNDNHGVQNQLNVKYEDNVNCQNNSAIRQEQNVINSIITKNKQNKQNAQNGISVENKEFFNNNQPHSDVQIQNNLLQEQQNQNNKNKQFETFIQQRIANQIRQNSKLTGKHFLSSVNQQIIENDNQSLDKNLIKQEENFSSNVVFDYKNDQNGQIILTKRQLLKMEIFKEEEAIKKIYSIFDSWKFNFIHIKKSDGGLTVLNKKWTHISKDQLLESFKTYTKRKSGKLSENDRHDEGHAASNGNNYLNYDIHQCIVLQKSKHTVKVEENYQSYCM